MSTDDTAPLDLLVLAREVLRLDGEATRGPWQQPRDCGCGDGSGCDVGEVRRLVRFPGGDLAKVKTTPQDAALIATYRSAAPTLAHAVLEASEEVATLRVRLAEIADMFTEAERTGDVAKYHEAAALVRKETGR